MTRSQAKKQQALATARAQAEKVQHELQIAGAELGLTQGALQRHLPPEVKKGDIGWALDQNAQIERKVQRAAADLDEVNDLLEQVAQQES